MKMIPKTSASTAETLFVDLVLNRLHITHGKAQHIEGHYPGKQVKLDHEMIRAHYKGEITFAFAMVAGTSARAMVFDIDADFWLVLPYYKTVLREVPKLWDAMFLTNGSKPGKGKIVIVLQGSQTAQARCHSLLEDVHARALRLMPAELRDGVKIDLFPTRDSYCICRIGGKHVLADKADLLLDKATQSLDYVISLDYDKIIPAARVRFPKVKQELRRRNRMGVIRRIVKDGLAPEMTKERRHKILFRLACEAHASRLTPVEFDTQLDQLAANSPDLPSTSIKGHGAKVWDMAYNSRESKRGRMLRGTLIYAPIYSEYPLLGEPRKRDPALLALLLSVMLSYCLATNQNPECFGGFTQVALRHAMGVGGSSVTRALTLAEAAGRLVIHHKGVRRLKGQPGLPTIYGLVPDGQSPEVMQAKHLNSFLLVSRRKALQEAANAEHQIKLAQWRKDDPHFDDPWPYLDGWWTDASLYTPPTEGRSSNGPPDS